MMASMIVTFQDTMVDFETTTGKNLQIEGLVEFHRELRGVVVNNFLLKMDCYLSGYLESVYTMFRGAP